jgi:hypothetical protein
MQKLNEPYKIILYAPKLNMFEPINVLDLVGMPKQGMNLYDLFSNNFENKLSSEKRELTIDEKKYNEIKVIVKKLMDIN